MGKMRTIHVGSRKSKLALVQSEQVIAQLRAVYKELDFSLDHIVTKGDQVQDVTLSKIGGKGLFVKEIEMALLNGTIDFAVHSMKDMPAELPEGLMIAAVPRRVAPADRLVTRTGCSLSELPTGSRIGTSSLRRAAQLLHARPDLQILDLRGNVDTRLKKLMAGTYDGIILADAGIKRLGLSVDGFSIPYETVLPAVGQGALAIECRAADHELREWLAQINDPETEQIVRAERAFLKKLNGSCQVPIAGHCVMGTDGLLELTGLVASLDGQTILREKRSGRDGSALGLAVAESLLSGGAAQLLAEALKASETNG